MLKIIYAKQDCEISYFVKSYKQNPKLNNIMINLYYEKTAANDIKVPSIWKLLLSVLNLSLLTNIILRFECNKIANSMM